MDLIKITSHFTQKILQKMLLKYEYHYDMQFYMKIEDKEVRS